MKIYIRLILLLLCSSCAQIISPTGGKKDEIAPKLIESYPKNLQKKVKESTVRLVFDEYVKVENPIQQIIITPTLEDNFYETTVKGKIVEFRFKKKFPENTTLSFNFGNSIRDFSEGNIGKNITLTFSTGSIIDSLGLSGKVVLAQSNKPKIDILVGLYPFSKMDTLKKVLAKKPIYISKTDSLGTFSFQNIKPNLYYLYAIEDLDNNLTWSAEKEKIGFSPEVIDLKNTIEGEYIVLQNFNESLIKTESIKNSSLYYSLFLNKYPKEVAIQFEKDSIPYLVRGKEIIFFKHKSTKDSLQANIIFTDSTLQKKEWKQIIIFKKSEKLKVIKENFTTTLIHKGSIFQTDTLTFIFNKPVEKMDISKIRLFQTKDSTQKIPFDYQQNSTKNSFMLWSKNSFPQNINIIFQKGAFISLENDTLISVKNRLTVLTKEDVGSISGKIFGHKEDEFIIQLLSENYKVLKTIFTKREYNFKNISPNDYYVRVVIDKNKNKREDTGNPYTRTPPEVVLFFSEKIKLRANFDVAGLDAAID